MMPTATPTILAVCGKVRLSRVARDGVEPSEAGAIPALSRNGDAPDGDASRDEPGRLARADVLSSAEGRFVRYPGRGLAAAPAFSGPTEDDHAVSHPPRPGPRGVCAALTVFAAACSTQASNTSATSGSGASSRPAARVFPDPWPRPTAR